MYRDPSAAYDRFVAHVESCPQCLVHLCERALELGREWSEAERQLTETAERAAAVVGEDAEREFDLQRRSLETHGALTPGDVEAIRLQAAADY